MCRAHLGWVILLAGCAGVTPPPPTPVAAPAEPFSLAMAPRREWRRIPLARGARLAGAYVASPAVLIRATRAAASC